MCSGLVLVVARHAGMYETVACSVFAYCLFYETGHGVLCVWACYGGDPQILAALQRGQIPTPASTVQSSNNCLPGL